MAGGSMTQLFLAVFLALLAQAALAAECDCENIDPTTALVCGVDGITYLNKCVAECQGVDVNYDAECGKGPKQLYLKDSRASSDAAAPAPAAAAAAAPTAPLVNYAEVDPSFKLDAAVLHRFSDAGYRFSAKLNFLQRGGPLMQGVPDGDTQQSASAGDSSFSQRQLQAALLTKVGEMYVRAVNPEDSTALEEAISQAFAPTDAASQATAGSAASPAPAPSAGRKMMFVGPDNRVELVGAKYPWTATGFLLYAGNRGCTGVLIGKRSVLTAGHCVYDTEARQLYDLSTMEFMPDQQGGPGVATGRKVGVSSVFTMYQNAGSPVPCGGSGAADEANKRCQPLADHRYDFAVLTLEEDVGLEFGYMGLGFSCDVKQYHVQTAGYPGDKPDVSMRLYGESGTLQAFSGCADASLEDNVITSDLDTAVGQSGSGIWDDSKVVRAIHVAATSTTPYHRSITRWVYSLVQLELSRQQGH